MAFGDLWELEIYEIWRSMRVKTYEICRSMTFGDQWDLEINENERHMKVGDLWELKTYDNWRPMRLGDQSDLENCVVLISKCLSNLKMWH